MLNPSQQQAVEHGEGPLLILAGAGAGKTHTLTERIAYLVERRGVAPGAILAVTFTNKAAKEMRERMAKRLGFSMEHYSPYRSRGLPLMGTFHSICLVFIREYPYLVGLSPNFSLYDEDDKTRIIREITKSDGASGDSVNVREILSTISRAKNSLESPDDFMTKANSYKSRDIAEIYAEYEKRLRASDAVDFDDILLLGLKVLQNPEARDRIAGRFDYVFVDEYQDTNDAQYKIVRILAERHRNLCVVGDDWQGIYSWRGANIKNILSFQKDFPDASVVKLEQNYRSTKTIISAANAVIKHNTENLEKTLWTDNPEGNKIHVVDAGNEREEARYIAERISEAGSPGEWAVLYRTNSQSRAIEEALVRSNIPYRIFGGVKFYERKEVKDLLAYMRLVANPHDRASLLRVVNVPARKLGAKSVETIVEYLENYSVDALSLVEMLDEIDGLGAAAREGFRQFASVLSRARARMQDESVANVMKWVVEDSGYIAYLQANHTADEVAAKRENLDEFLSLATRYEGLEPLEGYRLFLEEIALITDQDRDTDGERVSLLTIHLAKGLEFERVIIAGAEEGLFPHSRALTEAKDMEEERRLMYVAMTRAKKELYITRARERFTFGNYASNPPSRFLDEIPSEHVEIDSKWLDTNKLFANSFTSGFGSASAFAANTPSKPKAVKPKNDPGDFAAGDQVEHPQFGMGKIVGLRGNVADIFFGGYGIKKMNIEIAPVRKV